MPIDPPILARLEAQTTRADLILFTGAGFSSGADDSAGTKLPAGKALTEELWRLAFPTETFLPNTRLGDVFFAARMKGEAALRRFLNSRLSVRGETLPEWYRTWFSMPWQRCYTVNIDDLELAVSRRHTLPRPIRSISATSGRTQGSDDPNALEVIHLNGAIWDELQDMTFSPRDYGARLSTPDAAYIRCASDMVSRPVVVVGAELDESPLWQYLEARRARGRGLRELRPGSYLVTPGLNPARAVVLRELNVDLVRATAQEFSADALTRVRGAAETGLGVIRAAYHAEVRRSLPRLVSDLANEATPPTEYLMGHEPTWADVRGGRAIQRDFDATIYDAAKAILLSSQSGPPIALTGTAGSGKSTSLMRLGLRLAAEGITTYWIDEGSNIDTHMLRTAVTRHSGPIAILIDDADVWGRTLSGWARELPAIRPQVLLVASLRSSKVDDLLDPDALAGVELRELAMPHLTDGDIDALIAVLDANNRLGILKGKSHAERVNAFKEERAAGRQLLVAMIQATSGQSFRDKAFDEFRELPELPKLLYAITCFVHASRFSLDRQELLLAVGRADNQTLNEIEALVRRSLIGRVPIGVEKRATLFRSRGRVVTVARV